MARLIHGLDAARVRANLARVRAEIAAAGRDPAELQIVAACKYVACEELPVLAAAGVQVLGENRARELVRKVADHGALFEWDFIGTLQSKHVRAIVPHVRLIHSLASESALRELQRQAPRARAGLRVLIEVNLAGDPSKDGIAPERLPSFLERSPLPVAGLMTMPPLARDAEQSRPYFRRLRELAAAHGLSELSMGTTQDFAVAAQEGATIVRIGTRLFA